MHDIFTKTFFRFVFSAFVFLLAACGGGKADEIGDGGGGGSRVPDFQQVASSFTRSQYTQNLTVAPPVPDATDYENDSEFTAHHGLGQINADAAYRHGYYGQGVTIAIVEEGFYPEHPDLQGVIVTQAQNILGGGVSVFGETGVHGTYVAILAAGRRGNNGGGDVMTEDGRVSDTFNDAHGVAFSATVLAIQNRHSTVPSLLRATQSTAHIVNNSFGLGEARYFRRRNADGTHSGFYIWPGRQGTAPLFAPRLESNAQFRGQFGAIASSLKDKDQVFVWAAGNDNWNSVHTPRLCGKASIDEATGCSLALPGESDSAVEWSDLIGNFDAFRIRFSGAEFASSVEEMTFWYSLSTLWTSANGASITVQGGKTIYADLNDAGGWSSAPRFEKDLIGKWLVVGSVDRNNRISGFSNGCGGNKNWCLVAPGEGIRIGARTSPNGTSWAAPIASGALAVLKSRMPQMPMEVVLAVMLTSATPLGTREIALRNNEEDVPDDIYGWGLVNLSAAINLQGEVTLVSVRAGTQNTGNLLSGGAILPPHFARLPANLGDAKTAFGGVGGAYFHLPLSKMMRAESAASSLGDAAARMLSSDLSAGEIRDGALFAAYDEFRGRILHLGATAGGFDLRYSFADDSQIGAYSDFADSELSYTAAAAPFFAAVEDSILLEMRGMNGDGVRPFAAFGNGDAPWRKFGLRWRGGETISAVAEAAALSESRTVLGADFGALSGDGGAKAKSATGKFGLRGGFGQWRGFADYAVLHSDASAADGLLKDFSGLRAQEWTAGIARKNVFGADEIRLSYRRPPFLSGRAHFRVVSAEGSFADAFYKKQPQTLISKTVAADISGNTADIVSLGYARRLRKNTNFAIAAEHDLTSGDSAFSAVLRTRF